VVSMICFLLSNVINKPLITGVKRRDTTNTDSTDENMAVNISHPSNFLDS